LARVTDDPKPRKDRTCYVCRKPIPQVKPQRGVPAAVYEQEAFCSTKCARSYFGTSLPPTTYVDPDEEAA
jgi:predicted nucleic acid-binding Zn ribbon protein